MLGEKIREQLHQGGRVYGIHVCHLGGSHSAKHYSRLPLDFVFIDTEHIPLDRAEVSLMCRYYEANGVSPIVRIAYPNPHLASEAIDGGAQGIVVPYLESVDDVFSSVGAVHYRPLKGKVLHDHLTRKRKLKPETVHYLNQLNRNNYLLIGVESVPAYENLDELMSIAGVDAVFIGPHDLTVSMEIPEQYSHPDFVQTVLDITRRARKTGLGVGMHLKPNNADFDRIRQYLEAGMNWILYSHDVEIMTDKTIEIMDQLRTL